MKEKRRRARPWLWIGAAAALIVLCVFVSAKDGGGHLTDVPGGFYLQVSVLERGGAVTQYELRDEARIRDVQHYIHSQKAARLHRPGDAQPDYPYLGFSDGTRQAVYTGGVWADNMGRLYSVRMDTAELLALFPEAQGRSAALRDFPNRFASAALTGAWDVRLLERAETTPELGELQVRARERSEDKIYVTIFNPTEQPVVCVPDVRLEVLCDGTWYTVPALTEAEPPEETVVTPGGSALFTASVTDAERRYGKLPAGHYRIALLSYDAEFDVP